MVHQSSHQPTNYKKVYTQLGWKQYPVKAKANMHQKMASRTVNASGEYDENNRELGH